MRFLIIFCFLWIPLSTIVFMYLPGNSQMSRGIKKKKKKKKREKKKKKNNDKDLLSNMKIQWEWVH
jgi:predicted membrane protein